MSLLFVYLFFLLVFVWLKLSKTVVQVLLVLIE